MSTETTNTEYTPTQDLYKALFGRLPDQDISETDIPKLIAAIETLTWRESDTIKKRFGIVCEKRTLAQCGEDLGFGRERARTIQEKALRKLRHPSRAAVLIRPLFASRATLLEQLSEQKQEIAELTRTVHLLRAERTMFQNNLKNIAQIASRCICDDEKTPCGSISIDELDLSVRAWNCLVRAGVKTVNDLLAIPPEQIWKIRNLGKSAVDEITKKLNKLGIPFLTEE